MFSTGWMCVDRPCSLGGSCPELPPIDVPLGPVNPWVRVPTSPVAGMCTVAPCGVWSLGAWVLRSSPSGPNPAAVGAKLPSLGRGGHP